MSESQYRRVTHDLTLSVATLLAQLNPTMTFIYVSGAGTDSTGRNRSMWACVKGETENALLRLPFKAAFIPLDGCKSKTRSYKLFYDLLGPCCGRCIARGQDR